jgi:hypothetical protein
MFVCHNESIGYFVRERNSQMGRYVNQMQVDYDTSLLAPGIDQFMTAEGFAPVNYKGETLWKKGMGILTAPQYLSVTYSPNLVTIQAFIKWALIPGVYVGEMGTDGFVGAIPKKALEKRVRTVEHFINTFNPMI